MIFCDNGLFPVTDFAFGLLHFGNFVIKTFPLLFQAFPFAGELSLFIFQFVAFGFYLLLQSLFGAVSLFFGLQARLFGNPVGVSEGILGDFFAVFLNLLLIALDDQSANKKPATMPSSRATVDNRYNETLSSVMASPLYVDDAGQICRQKRRQDIRAGKFPAEKADNHWPRWAKESAAAGGKAMNHGKEEKRAAKRSSP